MKKHTLKREDQGSTSVLTKLLGRLAVLGFAVGALAIVPTRATGTPETDKGDNGNTPGVYGGGDDETVGTLPIVHHDQVIHLLRSAKFTRASLCIEGDLDEILNSIALVRGDASAKLEWVDAAAHRARLTFPNDVQIAFDRLALEGADLRIGMSIPDPYAYPVQDWLGSVNARHGSFSPVVGVAEIPIAALAHAGVLDQHPLQVHVGNFRSMTALTAVSSADFVTLRQTH